MLLLYSSPTLSITQQPDEHFVRCTWKGSQTEQTIRAGGWQILEIVKTHGATKILIDNTHVVGDWHQAAEWTFSVWFPKLMSLGITRFARVRAERMLPEATARRAIPDTDNIKSFHSEKDAIDWLSH